MTLSPDDVARLLRETADLIAPPVPTIPRTPSDSDLKVVKRLVLLSRSELAAEIDRLHAASNAIVTQVGCPFCGAKPGDPCKKKRRTGTDPVGTSKKEFHNARRESALGALQRDLRLRF